MFKLDVGKRVQGETIVKFEPTSASLQFLEALGYGLGKSKVLSVVLP